MSQPIGSMGPFIESYMTQTQRMHAQRKINIPDAAEVMRLFSERGVKSLSLLEIASNLMIRDMDAKDLSKELERKKLVTFKKMADNEYFVELTRLGNQLIKE